MGIETGKEYLDDDTTEVEESNTGSDDRTPPDNEKSGIETAASSDPNDTNFDPDNTPI